MNSPGRVAGRTSMWNISIKPSANCLRQKHSRTTTNHQKTQGIQAFEGTSGRREAAWFAPGARNGGGSPDGFPYCELFRKRSPRGFPGSLQDLARYRLTQNGLVISMTYGVAFSGVAAYPEKIWGRFPLQETGPDIPQNLAEG